MFRYDKGHHCLIFEDFTGNMCVAENYLSEKDKRILEKHSGFIPWDIYHVLDTERYKNNLKKKGIYNKVWEIDFYFAREKDKKERTLRLCSFVTAFAPPFARWSAPLGR